MSYYGGTITVKGRNLITSLLAGETLEFTRIVVGSGAMPEGVEPIDMEALVTPVAEAVSTIPVVENGEMFLTVEYRNDLNGGLKEGFWLSEFGIFAKTANSDEVLLYYATLGDSPQPVNAYKDNRIDIRRYPVTIALEIDANVQVSYNPGSFITAAEAQELIGGMVSEAMGAVGSAVITSIVIPAEGWTWQEYDDQEALEWMDEYRLVLDVACTEAKASHFPSVALDRSALSVAKYAGLCPTIEAKDGILRFWAKNEPEQDMNATVALLSASTGGSGGGGGGGTYVLPVATSTTLGGVRVQAGSGLNIDSSGNLSIDAATGEQAEELFDAAPGGTE